MLKLDYLSISNINKNRLYNFNAVMKSGQNKGYLPIRIYL